MAWFNKVDVSDPTEQPSITPDTEPSMWERLRSQSWFDWTLRIVAAVILVVVILFGARAIHHHYESKKTNTAGITSPLSPATSQNTKTQGSNTTNSSNSGSNSTNSNSAPTQKSTSGNTTTPTQLTNTGPGDVVAIFLVSTLAAASLHYVLQARRTYDL